jgi:hypothetical protein
MRSDYDQHLAKLPELQKLIENADVRATPLNASELREAIENSAEPVGLKLESGLVDRLIADVLGEPAALPLLQFTLLRLWQERDHNRLTLAAYNRLGGGRVALARTADTLYDHLIPQDQFTMRRILLRMVRPGAGASEVTSSRVRRAELGNIGDDPDRVVRVLQKLVDARLVRGGASDDPDAQVEVAHEALVRNWPRLVSWLDELRGQMTTRRRFETLADEWERFGRSTGLIGGAQLEEAERWLAGEEAEELGVRPLLRTFVETSRREADRQARVRRYTRNAQVAAVVLLAALVFAWVYAAKTKKTKTLMMENAALADALERNTKLAERLALESINAKQQRARAEEERTNAETARTNAQTEKELAVASAKKLSAAMKKLKETQDNFQKYEEHMAENREEVENMVDSALINALAIKDLQSEPLFTSDELGLGRLQRPIAPGASVSSFKNGTVCCVVTVAGERYLLMSGDIVGALPAKLFQPPAGTRGSMVVGSMAGDTDVPAMKLAPGMDATNVVPRRGLMKELTRPLKVNERVYMLGSKSGLVRGVVVLIDEYTIVTTIHAQSEDLGGPLLTEENELAGVVWASGPKLSFAYTMESFNRATGAQLDAR